MPRNDTWTLLAKIAAFIIWYQASDSVNFDNLAETLEELAKEARTVADAYSSERAEVCKNQFLSDSESAQTTKDGLHNDTPF